MILIKDYETLKLNTADAMNDYLEHRKENDEWIETKINKLRAFTMTTKSNDTSYSDDKINSFITENNIQGTVEIVRETLKDTGVFVSFPVKGKKVAYPLRYTAMDSTLARAGLGGRTMTNNEERPNQDVLPLEDKLKFMTRAFKLYNLNCKILIRDEKVSAIRSDQYAILPADELLKSLTDVLETDYPMAELSDGTANHEFVSFMWNLHDEDMEEEVRDRLSELGRQIKTIGSGICFVTSDTGDANATAYPYFTIDNCRLKCGNPVSVKHMGKKTAADFQKQLPKLDAMFKNNLNKIQELTNIIIRYPADCFRAVASQEKLPKKICMKIADRIANDYPDTCTAFDIYYHMHEVCDMYQAEDGTSIVNILRIQNAVAATLYVNYTALDAPFAWRKDEM